MTPHSSDPLPDLPLPVVVTTDTVDSLSIRVKMLETRMEENTELTQKSLDSSERVEKSTATLVEFAQNAQGALNSVNWLIKVLKPFAIIFIAFSALWGVFNIAKAYVLAAVANGTIK